MAQYAYISLCWDCGKVYTNDTVHICEVNVDNPKVTARFVPTQFGVVFDVYLNGELNSRTPLENVQDAIRVLGTVWDALVDSRIDYPSAFIEHG